MTTSTLSNKKVFLNKRFYQHIINKSNRANVEKSAELIRTFGGQIEQFLDRDVSYVLTDIPKNEWPPNASDSLLIRARNDRIKLMSLNDLLVWCSKYIAAPSSSDDDDEIKGNIKELQQPYIKLEDINCHFAPSVKEFVHWPEIKINSTLPIGRSIFSELNIFSNSKHSTSNINHPNNSAQLTQQAACLKSVTPNTTSQSLAHNQLASKNNTQPHNYTTNNNNVPREIKRRHSVYCEICSIKIADRIEEHVLTQAHKNNTGKQNWKEVTSVIDSLPSLSTLNMRRLTNLSPPNGVEHQEFLCLHKVDSVSQLFQIQGFPINGILSR